LGLVFAKLLSFEFCQKFFFGRQKNFENLFQNCFEIVFEKFAKSGESFVDERAFTYKTEKD
jgi:hypothetical protein